MALRTRAQGRSDRYNRRRQGTSPAVPTERAPDAIADVRALIDAASAEDRGAILHLRFMCTDVTVAAIIDEPVVAAVDWSTPPSRL
jgi:hypothetical protein